MAMNGKRGRPKTKEKFIIVNVGLPESFKLAYQKHASKNQRSLAAQVRYAMERDMAREAV